MRTNPSQPRVSAKGQEGGAVCLTQTLTVAKRIGRGRLGAIYAAVHDVVGRRFAVKVLRPALTRDVAMRQRLRQTVRQVSQIEHPHIVSLVDFGQLADGRSYLTMDFVRGIQLTKVLHRDKQLSPERALPILTQLADALVAAHRHHVAHGDLKPNNIMLIELPDGREQVRLHDFMLSPTLAIPAPGTDGLGQFLQMFGSVDYLAPEQLTDHVRTSPRADMYAFGAVAYELLTGEPPFVGEPDRVVDGHLSMEAVPLRRRSGANEVPQLVEDVVMGCLQKDARNRFKSMEEVARQLRSLIAPTLQLAPEEHDTDRWVSIDMVPAEEQPLPESQARVREMLYDSITELAEHAAEQSLADADMARELNLLRYLREESAQLVAQGAQLENRFEDIRRELRESESALRYAIIDLNLAKSDRLDRGVEAEAVGGLNDKLNELERSLAELGKQREQRFATLNDELAEHREKLRAIDQQMAVHYRRLYDGLLPLQPRMLTAQAAVLYRRVEQCCDAVSWRRRNPTNA